MPLCLIMYLKSYMIFFFFCSTSLPSSALPTLSIPVLIKKTEQNQKWREAKAKERKEVSVKKYKANFACQEFSPLYVWEKEMGLTEGRDFCLSDRKWISYNSILTSPFSNLENCLDPYSRYLTHNYTHTSLHTDTSQRRRKRCSCRVGNRTADSAICIHRLKTIMNSHKPKKHRQLHTACTILHETYIIYLNIWYSADASNTIIFRHYTKAEKINRGKEIGCFSVLEWENKKKGEEEKFRQTKNGSTESFEDGPGG